MTRVVTTKKQVPKKPVNQLSFTAANKVIEKDKKTKVTKSTASLASYVIKAIISTGKDSFSNIQPEITVNAKSIEDAYAFVKPHLDQLHTDYFQKYDKPKVVQVPTAPQTARPAGATTPGQKNSNSITKPEEPAFNGLGAEALKKPSQASFIKPAPKAPVVDNDVETEDEEKPALKDWALEKQVDALAVASKWFGTVKSAIDNAPSEEALNILEERISITDKCTDAERIIASKYLKATILEKFSF